jgi:hypothetical protein
MSSVGVLKKKSKCPKKNFQSVEGRKKDVSVGFRVFEKKMNEKFRKKNQSVFFDEN